MCSISTHICNCIGFLLLLVLFETTQTAGGAVVGAKLIHPKINRDYNLTYPEGISIHAGWSQAGQDRIVHDSLRQMKDGYFIEAGAHDCEDLSNTLFLEKRHHWSGLLVEANPDSIRHCILVNRHLARIAWTAIDIGDGRKQLPFRMAGAVGGLIDNLNEYRSSRITDYANSENVDAENVIQVPVSTLEELLIADGRTCEAAAATASFISVGVGDSKSKGCFVYKTNKDALVKKPQDVPIEQTLVVDFFSLDTEGSEAIILDAIDFNKITIGVLLVEWNKLDEQLNAIRNATVNKYSDIIEVVLSNEYFGRLDRMFYSKKYFKWKGWNTPMEGVREYRQERNELRAAYKAAEGFGMGLEEGGGKHSNKKNIGRNKKSPGKDTLGGGGGGGGSSKKSLLSSLFD